MKRLAALVIGLFSFGMLLADCAAPVELMLENTVETPEQVHLTYGYDTASWAEGTDDAVAYRARNEGGVWVDISRITINGIFTMDIGTDPCVTPGTWTYAIPFSCYEAACNCRNYAEVMVPNHGANCIDTTQPTALTSEEFAAKLRNESWYEPPDFDYPEEEPAVDDDPAVNESTPFADDTVTPDDAPVGTDIGNDQNDEVVVPVNDTSTATDTNTAVTETKKEASGCSLTLL